MAAEVAVMARFVILEHDHPVLHWDLMLEAGPALRTWRLGAPPAPGQAVDAEASVDHRLLYLDYEGPVPGNRGRVLRWDHGTFAWARQDEGEWAVELCGGRLRGLLRLERTGGPAWLATFVPGAGQGG
jgi:hypothetical protein